MGVVLAHEGVDTEQQRSQHVAAAGGAVLERDVADAVADPFPDDHAGVADAAVRLACQHGVVVLGAVAVDGVLEALALGLIDERRPGVPLGRVQEPQRIGEVVAVRQHAGLDTADADGGAVVLVGLHRSSAGSWSWQPTAGNRHVGTSVGRRYSSRPHQTEGPAAGCVVPRAASSTGRASGF